MNRKYVIQYKESGGKWGLSDINDDLVDPTDFSKVSAALCLRMTNCKATEYRLVLQEITEHVVLQGVFK